MDEIFQEIPVSSHRLNVALNTFNQEIKVEIEVENIHPLFSLNIETIKTYLETEIYIPRDEDGNSPLHTHYNVEIIHLLLEKGMNPNSRNLYGQIPLHFDRDPKIIDLLLQYNSNVNALDSWKQTPLQCHDNPSNLKRLIEAGADPYIKDSWGRNALWRYNVLRVYEPFAGRKIWLFWKRYKWYKLEKLTRTFVFIDWYYKPGGMGYNIIISKLYNSIHKPIPYSSQ